MIIALNKIKLLSSDIINQIAAGEVVEGPSAALKELTQLLDIPLEDALAIGDNYNDISMIETAGIGTCVANAHEDIKKVCDYVSPLSHDENAVADILEKFVL